MLDRIAGVGFTEFGRPWPTWEDFPESECNLEQKEFKNAFAPGTIAFANASLVTKFVRDNTRRTDR